MVGIIKFIAGLISLLIVVWFTFSVNLGQKTLYQHMRDIGGTPEAKELGNGIRARVDEVKNDVRTQIVTPDDRGKAPASPSVESASQPSRTDVSAADRAALNDLIRSRGSER